MRKIAWLMSLMMVSLMLAGCQAASTVKPTKLSEDEQGIFNLLGDYAAMFDLNMGSGVRSVHVNLYKLEGGQWQPLVNGGRPFAEKEEHIVISVNQEDGKLRLSSGGDTVSFTQDALALTSRSILAASLDEKTELEWEAEVPVYLYVETSADSVAASLGSFYHPEQLAQHERVYALTVMVSQKDVQ